MGTSIGSFYTLVLCYSKLTFELSLAISPKANLDIYLHYLCASVWPQRPPDKVSGNPNKRSGNMTKEIMNPKVKEGKKSLLDPNFLKKGRINLSKGSFSSLSGIAKNKETGDGRREKFFGELGHTFVPSRYAFTVPYPRLNCRFCHSPFLPPGYITNIPSYFLASCLECSLPPSLSL